MNSGLLKWPVSIFHIGRALSVARAAPDDREILLRSKVDSRTVPIERRHDAIWTTSQPRCTPQEGRSGTGDLLFFHLACQRMQHASKCSAAVFSRGHGPSRDSVASRFLALNLPIQAPIPMCAQRQLQTGPSPMQK